ncbi:MAG: GTP-binding protein [Methanobacteriota archaeon]|nr:MAG: GTP-binding protein [Euryarchaeota archaeon]
MPRRPPAGFPVTAQKQFKVKVCLVGEKAVGKTSLIRRYVLNMFDDRYITTIGTKVSKKELSLYQPERDVQVRMDVTIWDIMGEKGFRELLKDAYFYGANGILAVADLTRRKTLDELDDWVDGVMRVCGRVPTVIAVNKADLMNQAQFDEKQVDQFAKAFDSKYVYTSAKTGQNVEEAFRLLGEAILGDILKAKAGAISP